MQRSKNSKENNSRFLKSLTGVPGLDDITHGGLPKNRPTLILGTAGCGKTILALEFLVNGIEKYDEPGVFMAFEEKAQDLIDNARSLTFNLNAHISKGKLHIEHVGIERSLVRTTGQYDLEGLFIRLGQATSKVKARRIVLDSLDMLFSGLDHDIVRLELLRLFSWLKENKLTAIVTGEAGKDFMSRQGIEEYIADCVIILDNRISDQASTRRLRIIKYRGSRHGNNEYPFTIDDTGITVFPIISEPLKQKISSKTVSSGISDLDEMFGKKGYFIGSSTLISGTAGTGKTSIAATFAASVCREKQKCLYCAFEEAPEQVMRNMKSIGLSLDQPIKSGHLQFYSSRPTIQNLELHFITIKKIIAEINPLVVILDPITNLMSEGPNSGVRLMLTRFVDYLKTEQITVVFTAAITEKLIERNPSDEGISSMVDTWIVVQDSESEAERNRTCTILKSRGMAHSRKVKELVISSKGLSLRPISQTKARDRDKSQAARA